MNDGFREDGESERLREKRREREKGGRVFFLL